jgi:hypothetical protein
MPCAAALSNSLASCWQVNATVSEKSHIENDPELQKYWAKRGPKTAAFLLVIPGCTVLGYRLGLLLPSVTSYAVMGFGAGLLVWGLVVALTD